MNPEIHTKLSWKKKAAPKPGNDYHGAAKKVRQCIWNPVWIFFLLFIVTLPAGCFPHKKMTVVAAASLLEDIATSSYKQSDLRVIREGMPAYLLLMDGMVEAWPTNERLLIGAAQGYASYASAFVEDREKGVLKNPAKSYLTNSKKI
jgi:hypothetical protein